MAFKVARMARTKSGRSRPAKASQQTSGRNTRRYTAGVGKKSSAHHRTAHHNAPRPYAPNGRQRLKLASPPCAPRNEVRATAWHRSKRMLWLASGIAGSQARMMRTPASLTTGLTF